MAGRTARTEPITPHARGELLGGMSPATFLHRCWQKQALLVRLAIAGFTGSFGAAGLFALARRDDVESRLVVRDGTRRALRQGPFRRADLKALPERNWTLLLQCFGRRRWRFGRQDDIALKPALPLKILRFHAAPPRAAFGIDEPDEAKPLVELFEAIWASAAPGIGPTVLGLG